MLNDRRNPALARADGEEFSSYAGRLDEYISRLVWQSEGHRMWYTHKNPYGCWICDIIFIVEQLRTLIVPEDVDTSQNSNSDGSITSKSPKT